MHKILILSWVYNVHMQTNTYKNLNIFVEKQNSVFGTGGGVAQWHLVRLRNTWPSVRIPKNFTYTLKCCYL
jgi:hypothetical protein